MKKHLLLIAVAGSLVACNNEEAKEKEPEARQVAQYSIEQFYKSTNVGGGAFSSDDKKAAHQQQ